jgi:hypothetical protein
MPDFSEISPHLDVRISPRARRLALRLNMGERRVVLVIPKRASLRNAYAFALAHREWIEHQISKAPEKIIFAHGSTIPVLGRNVIIVVDRETASARTQITLSETTLTIRTQLENPAPRIVRFLKALAAKEFKIIADQKAALIGKQISQLSLRDMKTRWGSCSTDGRMALSWRLIFAPTLAYDYVIAHEAAHLTHAHHGPTFWALCERLAADFKTGHGWMKENGAELMRYSNG